MTKQKLIELLESLRDTDDVEAQHSDADEALLAYIADEEIKAAYRAVKKWYA